MYGRDLCMPVDVTLNPKPDALRASTGSTYMDELHNRLHDAYQRVRHKTGPKLTDPTQYRVGDRVLVRVPHGPLSLQAPFEGPTTIEGIHGGNTYTITPAIHDKHRLQERVSGDQIIPFVEGLEDEAPVGE
ncbi:hypothetical protein H4R33_007228, partial [Dimargaris cristalligena]